MEFTAPTAEQVLAIKVNAGIDEIAAHERFAAASPDISNNAPPPTGRSP